MADLKLEAFIMYDAGDAFPPRERFLGAGFATLEDAIDCANQDKDELPQIDDKAEYGERYVRITGPTTVEDNWGNQKEVIKKWDFPRKQDPDFRGAIEQWHALGGPFRDEEAALSKISKALQGGRAKASRKAKAAA